MLAKLGCCVTAWFGFALLTHSVVAAEKVVEEKTTVSTSETVATHEQTGTIPLTDEGSSTQVNTFCLDPKGRLLVAVGGTTRKSTEGDGKSVTTGNRLDVYSLEGKKLESWETPIVPQSINVAPDGSIFIAGAGEIAHLDAQGKLLKKAASPVVIDIDNYKKELKDQLEKQREERKQDSQDQVDRAEQVVQKLKDKPKAEMGALDKLRLKNAERILAKLKAGDGESAAEPQVDLDFYLSYKQRVPGMAVTAQDVFVVFSAEKGYGYDVWRMSHDLTQPEKIISGLSGCCGQMDIQCCGDDLFVAENSRHRVGHYNRTGEQVAVFGKGDRTGRNGFEGCCNPMNLRSGLKGEVLTAESNGAVKRYTTGGEFLGLIGMAQLQGGCKHVAIAATADTNKVFMLDITNRRLCVLEAKPKQTASKSILKQR